jgi:hypothetical protein
VLTLISAGIRVFYSTGGERFTVESIYGESIELYGDGIYKYNSVLAAGASKGTDFVMIIVAVLFSFFTVMRKTATKYKFLHVGLLSGLLYYSINLVFGITFNRLFPIYILLFSFSLFTMIFLLNGLIKEDNISEILNSKTLKGTAIFIIICGFSVLVWLPYIIPALISGHSFEIYTTEPTFVLDFGIILPLFLGCGILILKKKIIGYKLASIPLTLMPIIGLVVIGQSIFQILININIPIKELIGLVVSFIILGIISIILNINFMKYVKEEY